MRRVRLGTLVEARTLLDAEAGSEGTERSARGDGGENRDHVLRIGHVFALCSLELPAVAQGSAYDSSAAPVLPRRRRARVVLAGCGRAAPRPAVAVRAGPPARGGVRRRAVPARGSRARADRGGPSPAAARPADARPGRGGAGGGRRRPPPPRRHARVPDGGGPAPLPPGRT